jgi:hypothetical protein
MLVGISLLCIPVGMSDVRVGLSILPINSNGVVLLFPLLSHDKILKTC